MSSSTVDDVCQLCGTPEAGHGAMRHPFVREGQDPGSAVTNDPKKRKTDSATPPPGSAVVAPGLGGDPVLRLALINRGVISLADIIAAEQSIAASAAGGQPVFAGSPEAGRPEDRPAHT